MATATVRPDRIGHVSLRVRNLRHSMDFYRGLIGLYPRQTDPPSALVRVCSPSSGSEPARASVILTEGLPAGSELTGLDHFSLVVATNEDVDQAYRQAVAQAIRATEPRVYAGRYQTFLFDPDGYKIEIRAEQPG